MNERDWKLLLVLYDQKSITKAAGALHVTQPALSARLRLIEDFFGTQIVVREKRGIQFTPEGEYLVGKARGVLQELDQIQDELDSMKSVVSGTLRIGASHFFTRYILPVLLKDFKAQHAAVEFKVHTGRSDDLVQQVLRNDIHLAFIREERAWAGIKRFLFSEYLLLVHRDAFKLEDLPKLPQIYHTNDPANQMLIHNWWAEHFDVPPRVGMVVDHVDTCLEMIKMGLGYGFLPARILRRVKGLYAQKMCYLSGEFLERSTWMILKEETAELGLIRAFLDLMDNVNFSGPEYI